jgi:hypothetical protein
VEFVTVVTPGTGEEGGIVPEDAAVEMCADTEHGADREEQGCSNKEDVTCEEAVAVVEFA